VETLYTARDVARIFGLHESRVRYWAQTGFVGPSAREGGRGVYTFQDLISVKAAKELLERGVTLQRARKSVEALRAQLPQVDRPLTRLRVIADGERVVVVDDEAPFEPLSGQLVMDFAVGALEGRVAEVMKLAGEVRARAAGAETAYAWFLDGVRLDAENQDDEALIAFQKALDRDPQLAAAHTNIGNLLHRRGDLEGARTHYRTALDLDPAQPEARYNLGNLLDDLGDRDGALAQWCEVVTTCPEFADAHYNLALALAEEGARERARTHARCYLELDPTSEWAERTKALLERL
jgi:tetratricopeptide (TPR) repeat protein